jgi:tetratricopeptide (TPR) repeat protein
VTGCVVFLLAAGIASYTNIRVIQADIVYKLADPFTRNGQWPVAITIYDHANTLAPNEDYYYLFLGRAYLENAKTLGNEEERNLLISQAEADLKQAQRINPLNTDHTANLARLFSLWSSFVQDSTEGLEKGQISDKYFASAVSLSPQNVRIWDEWALLYMNILSDEDAALERLMTALEIDPAYHWTYGLLGEYYSRLAQQVDSAGDPHKYLAIAADYFSQALDKRAPGEPQARYGYALALGGAASQLGDYKRAIDAYTVAVELSTNNKDTWRVEEAIATLYIQLEDYELALLHALNSTGSAPPEEQERLRNLVEQLQQLLKK